MDFTALAGAGAIRSTAPDMLRFLAANLPEAAANLTPVLATTREPQNEAMTLPLVSFLGTCSLTEDGLPAQFREEEDRRWWTRNQPILCFATESLNKNTRSMAMDGEILADAAGYRAPHSLLHSARLSAEIARVDSIEEVEKPLPTHLSPILPPAPLQPSVLPGRRQAPASHLHPL